MKESRDGFCWRRRGKSFHVEGLKTEKALEPVVESWNEESDKALKPTVKVWFEESGG